MTEGVDFSRTATANWTGLATALRAEGKTFAGRYAVTDKSPNGRGISAAEYHAMRDAGVDNFLYWEGEDKWMLGGFDAGVRAAQNAQANIVAAGMPAAIPIHFAHDIEPQRQHLAAIDACLSGAASVIGWERVGGYGGKGLIDYLAQGGTVKFLCQTNAWEWHLDEFENKWPGAHPAATLYQYNTGTNIIGGANCDLVRALMPLFGQASAFLSGPPIEPTDPPAEHIPSVPWDESTVGDVQLKGSPALAYLGETTAMRDVPVRVAADSNAKIITTIKTGERVKLRGSVRTTKNRYVLVDLGERGIGRALWSAFKPRFPVT